MAYTIDATATAGYQPKESDGPAALLDKEGVFDCVILKAKRNEKKAQSGNTTVSFTLIVQDSDFDGAKGATIYHSFPVEGAVQSGTNAGRPNVNTLIDLCFSAGRTDLSQEIIGKKFDLDAVLAALEADGKTTHVFPRLTHQEGLNGRMESKPQYYLTKGREKYEEMRTAGGNNFRSTPRTAKRAPTQNGASNGAGQVSSGAVSDAMSSEV